MESFQKNIIEECFKRKRGCLCVPMGSGKTFMALKLSTFIKASPARNTTLVVCSKTLIESWVFEIDKFYGDTMSCQIFQSNCMNKKEFNTFKPDCDIVITTPDVLAKFYKQLNIKLSFVESVLEERQGGYPVTVNRYYVPTSPFLNKTEVNIPGAFLYFTRWKFIFIDEIQTFTNASTARCQAIASLFSNHKWGLSGTPLNEPTPERILGLNLMMGEYTFPNSIPDVTAYIKSKNYPGLSASMVIRTTVDFIIPSVIERIVEHELSNPEKAIYESLKTVSKHLRDQMKIFKSMGDVYNTRLFGAYILAMITMTRQFLICPLVPLARLLIDSLCTVKYNEMANLFKIEMNKLNLQDYFANPDSVKSSRISAICDVVDKLGNEPIVIFTCFRTSVNVISEYLSKDRPQFILKSNHNSRKRIEIINDFKKSTNGILLITYEMGAEGLNLQEASCVILTDVWWNSNKAKQAISRVVRRGQEKHVNVIFFTSNTGIEKGLFVKHDEKNIVMTELMKGPITSKIKKLTIDTILSLITDSNNVELLKKAIK